MLRGYIVTDVLHSFLPGPSHLAPKYRQPGMIRYDWEKQGISEVFCWRLIEFATSQWSMQKSAVFLSHVFDCLFFLLSGEHPRRHVQVWPSISCCSYVTMLPSLFSIFLIFLMCLNVVDVDPQTIRHFLLAPGAIGAERGPRWDRRHRFLPSWLGKPWTLNGEL